jgi:NAD(P)H-hydrate epimerase
MRYYTKAEIREAERRCIEVLGIPSVVLMSHAGRAVYEQIEKGPVGIVCGKGKNGGDGFVVARWCIAHDLEPHVVLLAELEDVRGDTLRFMKAYEKMGGSVQLAEDDRAAIDAVRGLSHCSCLVDALIGTGNVGEVRGCCRKAMEVWPKVYTISVDLPSGMDPDTGKPNGACVKADKTVTFQFPKAGFEAPWAKEYVGELVVADVGIPPVCSDDEAWAKLGLEDT